VDKSAAFKARRNRSGEDPRMIIALFDQKDRMASERWQRLLDRECPKERRI
jgi:hypothetical protein